MRRFVTVSAMIVAAYPAIAGASPVNARLSASGLDYVSKQVPALIPTHLEPADLTETMFSCDNGDATFTQQDTKIDITINSFSMSIPKEGTIRLTVGLSGTATGSAYLYHLYACYGDETCGDAVNINGAIATIDMGATVDTAGKPHVTVQNVDLQLTKDQIDVTITDCPESGIADAVIDAFKSYGLNLAEGIIEDMAQEKIGPLVESMIGDFVGYKGDIGIAQFVAVVTGLDIIPATGLTVHGDVDVTSKFPAAACVLDDPGEPAAFPGVAPDMSAGVDAHVTAEVNLGLVQDALYHVWHEGFLCITPDSLASFGIDLSALDIIGTLLPGFPDGTKFSIDANFDAVPQIIGNPSDAGKLTLSVKKVQADLIAKLPDNTERRLHLDLDASATATLALDPTINSLSLSVDAVTIDRLAVDDQLGLSALGFDYARVKELLETLVLPQILAGIGQVPVTGPIFGGIDGMYVILKGIQTTDSWIAVKADLFHAPADDFNDPTTTIDEKPTKVVKPADAKLIFGGADREDPAQLLKFTVSVDGAAASAPSFVRTTKVGVAGKTASYHVVVKAIDLAGNEDPVGATADVLVDGVLPTISVSTVLRGTITDAVPTISWTAQDDHSTADKISARLEVSQLQPSGEMKLIATKQIAAGVTTTTIDALENGQQYQVSIIAIDEAGNEAPQAFIFMYQGGASSSSGCSVAVAGHSAPFAAIALLFSLGLVVVRRRRAA